MKTSDPWRMKKKLFVLVALLFIGLFLQVALWKSEPMFEGKPLSYWLDQLPSTDIGTDGRSETISLPAYDQVDINGVADTAQIKENLKKANEALSALGTNHLHLLVERLQAKDSAVAIKMWQLGDRLGIADYTEYQYAEFRRGQALSAFQYLGARAAPVVPQLLELTSAENTNIRLLAWSALERVSPEEFRKRPHPAIIEHAPAYR